MISLNGYARGPENVRFHEDLCQVHSGSMVVVEHFAILPLTQVHEALPS